MTVGVGILCFKSRSSQSSERDLFRFTLNPSLDLNKAPGRLCRNNQRTLLDCDKLFPSARAQLSSAQNLTSFQICRSRFLPSLPFPSSSSSIQLVLIIKYLPKPLNHVLLWCWLQFQSPTSSCLASTRGPRIQVHTFQTFSPQIAALGSFTACNLSSIINGVSGPEPWRK